MSLYMMKFCRHKANEKNEIEQHSSDKSPDGLAFVSENIVSLSHSLSRRQKFKFQLRHEYEFPLDAHNQALVDPSPDLRIYLFFCPTSFSLLATRDSFSIALSDINFPHYRHC